MIVSIGAPGGTCATTSGSSGTYGSWTRASSSVTEAHQPVLRVFVVGKDGENMLPTDGATDRTWIRDDLAGGAPL
ncbi:hypothetical protein A2U01_0058881, partial [Trifolium medium]|nr:hypothetical protein [Trifolium medium]